MCAIPINVNLEGKGKHCLIEELEFHSEFRSTHYIAKIGGHIYQDLSRIFQYPFTPVAYEVMNISKSI